MSGLCKHVYVQVLIAILAGFLLAAMRPELGQALKPLGDGFIKLIKMLIAPVVFTTVVLGIAKMGSLRHVGRVGLKALLYFEVISSFALLIGLVVGELVQPGAGIHADPAALDTSSIQSYTSSTAPKGAVDFVLNLIPQTAVDAFAKGDVLQVLVFSVLFGLALSHLRERGGRLVDSAANEKNAAKAAQSTALGQRMLDAERGVIAGLEHLSEVFIALIQLVTRLAPIGAFGAIAFTIGKFGPGVMLSLGSILLAVYLTCLLFVFGVLGLIARWSGYRLWALLRYIRDELVIVLGTSSSETVLPILMRKLEDLGCDKAVVGLVTPMGYSFNLDGTSIYLTMAVVFIAQAMDVSLSLEQELTILAVLMLTSKGAAAVVGSAFVTLAATLATLDTVPVAGLALLLGVDRFMSEARAITNLIGNAVATIAIARWEGSLDETKLLMLTQRPDRSTSQPPVN